MLTEQAGGRESGPAAAWTALQVLAALAVEFENEQEISRQNVLIAQYRAEVRVAAQISLNWDEEVQERLSLIQAELEDMVQATLKLALFAYLRVGEQERGRLVLLREEKQDEQLVPQ